MNKVIDEFEQIGCIWFVLQPAQPKYWHDQKNWHVSVVWIVALGCAKIWQKEAYVWCVTNEHKQQDWMVPCFRQIQISES